MGIEYTFRILNQDEYLIWDSFVDRSLQGTLFHKSEWLSISDSEYRIFGCYNKGEELTAGFVCGVNRLYDRWTFFTHPIMTPYLGNIYAYTEGKYVTQLSRNKKLCYEIAKMLKEQCDTINISLSAYGMDDVMPFIWAGFSVSLRYTYVIDLSDLDSVWKNMDQKTRNDISKARDDGILVNIESGLEEPLNHSKKTFKRQGMELDAGFIESAIRYQQAMQAISQCKSFVATTKDGKSIAASFIVWDNKRGYELMAGYDYEYAHRGALALAKWTAFEYLRNTFGLMQFDFEGTTMLRIEHPIRQFGGKLVPYYSIKWVHPKLKPFLTTKQLVRDIYQVFRPENLDGKI